MLSLYELTMDTYAIPQCIIRVFNEQVRFTTKYILRK